MLEFRRCGWLLALGSRFRSSSDAAAGSQPHAGAWAPMPCAEAWRHVRFARVDACAP